MIKMRNSATDALGTKGLSGLGRWRQLLHPTNQATAPCLIIF